LVKWENTTNEEVLERARAEIWQSWRRACADQAGHPRAAELFDRYRLPAFHDPFAGGGALPLEAQRLGLEAWASDLNPVAVLINKAMIEIPPKFAGQPPVNPAARQEHDLFAREWQGARGLAEDVRHYGKWMREEAEKRIGHLYPQVEITAEMAQERPDLKAYAGKKLTVIAWLWARTVKSPNPGCGARTPMVRSFWLSTKTGKKTYAHPELNHADKTVTFSTRFEGEPLLHTSDGKGARCLFCDQFIQKAELRQIATDHGTDPIPLAIVCEGNRGRIYLPPSAQIIPSIERPDVEFLDHPMANDRRWFSPPLYGMPNYADLFTPRQLVALTTFSDLVPEARERALQDALAAGMTDDGKGLDEGGTGRGRMRRRWGCIWGLQFQKLQT
jgi:putative DNA methylase